MKLLAQFIGSAWDTVQQLFWGMAEPRRQEPNNPDEYSEKIHLALQNNQEVVQSIMGLLRLTGALITMVGIVFAAGHLLESVDAPSIAARIKETNLFFSDLNPGLLTLIIRFVHPANLRYIIAPLAGVLMILLSAGNLVRDLYNLPNLRQGFHYVKSSMFGLGYPVLNIHRGQADPAAKDLCLIRDVGGPGYLIIQPGNVVVLRTLRDFSSVEVSSSHFLAPFERIAQIANLDEQHGYAEELSTLTRDGIRITLQDIHFRYHILQADETGRRRKRSMDDPYPYSREAMVSIAANLAVAEDGQESWRSAVKRTVLEQIITYVNAHDLDHLTAPRREGQDPRARMHEELMVNPETRSSLSDLGAELLWVDIGHLEINEPGVENQRLDLWTANISGKADLVRAEGEAKRKALHELGKATAQARMINSIARVMKDVDLDNSDSKRVRSLVLMRISQMLDAMHDQQRQQENDQT